MNPNWKNFLLSKNALFDNDTDIVFPSPEREGNKRIYPIAHLGVLTIAGSDAAKFLQGQITCNINDITDIKSSLGALCNPKGRAITTFLLVKNSDAFFDDFAPRVTGISQEKTADVRVAIKGNLNRQLGCVMSHRLVR